MILRGWRRAHHSARANRKEQYEYDRDLYKERLLVACLIGKTKHYRRVFSRFEKLAKITTKEARFVDATYPLRSKDVLVHNLENETLLLDAQGTVVHVLNLTARFIWERCDGHNSVEDIIQALAVSFAGASEYDLSADVRRMLQVFGAKNLLA